MPTSFFFAVGTPIRRGGGSYAFEAVGEMAPHLDGSFTIATKSTVPVGTCREIKRRLRELRPDVNIAVCSNPEFLREGSAIRDDDHTRVFASGDAFGEEALTQR